MTDGAYAHGDIRQLFSDDKRLSDELIKNLKMQLQLAEQVNESLQYRLQQAERARDDYYNNYLRILADADMKELRSRISMQAEMVSQLQQDKDVLEAKLLAAKVLNYQAEAEALSAANTAMREELEWYGAEKNNRNIRMYAGFDSWVKQDGGKRARDILSRYPKEEGKPNESNREN